MIIPGFTNYDISEDGVVTDIATGKAIKAHVIRPGGFYAYKNVRLADDKGIYRLQNIMRLLALTYLPKPTAPCMARAKDGNNLNTVASNVEWVPYTENAKRAWADGKMSNRRARQSSVTEDLVELVYDTLCIYGEPVTMTALSNELDMPYSAVRYSMLSLIKRGKAIKTPKGFEAVR